MVGNKPIKSFKAGAVKASIFENESQYKGKQSTIHRVVIDKTYKDPNGQWKSTNSFSGYSDLPKAILVLQKSYEFLALKNYSDDNKEKEFDFE